MTTTQTTPVETNKYGFPVVTCYRCGGSGMFGPMSIEGGRCFGCGGTGKVVRRGKAAKAWSAFLKAQPAKTATVGALKVGDLVLPEFAPRKLAGVGWVAVTKVEVTPERCGSCLIGTDEADRVHYYYHAVTLADGTTKALSQNALVRRFVTQEMLPNPRDYWSGE